MAILITTSRRPTRRMRTFCRDLTRSIPNAFQVNRGKSNINGIAERATEFNADRVVIVSRWKGGPGKIEFFRIDSKEGLTQIPPLLHVGGIRLQSEFKTRPSPFQSLTLTTQTEGSRQIMKIAEFLSTFLKIPTSSSIIAASNYKATMHISSSDLHEVQITFLLIGVRTEAVEVGPHIKVSRVTWET